MPHTQAASAIAYRPEDGVEVVVEFESTQCEPCGNDCVDLTANEEHCGRCNAAIGPEQACEGGEAVCLEGGLTACGMQCVDLLRDRNNCGECGRMVEFCVDGEPAEPPPPECDFNETVCGAFCINTQNNATHCGECFHLCPPAFEGCYVGYCSVIVEAYYPDVGPCIEICAAQGFGCHPQGNHRAYHLDSDCTIECDDVPGVDDVACSGGGQPESMQCECTEP